MSKIRIAIIKFGGLSVGGSERFLQVVAANLNRDLFDVDYYYCDAAPYLGSNRRHADTHPDRLKYMQEHKVRLVKFHVEFRDLRKPTFDWIGTDFWELFDERSYDLALTVKSGHPEYPFTKLKIPLVEIVGLPAGIDSKPVAHIHPSQYQLKAWLKLGGNLQKSYVIPPPPTPPQTAENLRSTLKIPEAGVVAGFHQRADDAIFSPIPLQAFASCWAQDRYFIILGGGKKYRNQAKELGLKNIYFLPETGDPNLVSQFLNTLDVFAHGRGDGETYGAVLAEAMLHGKPCLSHAVLRGGNAQPETIGPAGWFAINLEEYTEKLDQIYRDPLLRKTLSKKSRSHAQEYFSLDSCLEELTRLFQKICGLPELSSTRKKIPYSLSPLGFLYAGDLDQPGEIAHHVLAGHIPEEFHIQVVKFFLPKIRTFIDVGANTGLYGLVAAKECPSETKVHCFEPQSRLCQILKKTVDLNNWEDRVFVHPNYFIRDLGISNIDFIKIDVEGIELLEESKEVLNKHRPVLFVEIPGKLKNRERQYTETIGWLQANGYAIFRVAENRSRFHHFGTISKISDLKAPREKFMYLCLPREKEFEVLAPLKKHLRAVNKILMKNRIKAAQQKGIRLLKNRFKKTPLYPIFYRLRSAVKT